RLLALPDDVKARYDVSSLRHMIHAAAPCPVEIKRRMIDWWGPAIDEYYAASEGGGTYVTTDEWLKKPGTVGKPWPISEVVVLDAAAFGIPHEDWGEEIKAVVEPADGVEPGPELERELIEFLGMRLARYKVPRSIDFMAELPRDPNGKLYKRRLRDPYWEGRE